MKPYFWLPGTPMPYFFLSLLFWLAQFFLDPGRAIAQEMQAPPQPLAIGQRVPDVPIPNIINYPVSSASIADFKGKLLLLDFWATWCGSCKASLPKLQALQNEFPNQLQVLLITRDTRAKAEAFFSKWKNTDGSPYTLPSAADDSLMSQLFPYLLVPHFVWIGPDGVVQAITTAEHVTSENIRRALQDSRVQVPLKKDIDLEQPLFAGAYLPKANLRHYAILLKGRIDGLPSGSRYRKHKGQVVGRAITNLPLLDHYQVVAYQLIPDFDPNRLLLEVSDKSALVPEKSSLSPDAWNREHLYSYDQISPPAEVSTLYQRMLEDLNRYSGYHGTIEQRTVRCLVLQLTGSPKKMKTKGGRTQSTLTQKEGPRHLQNAPLLYLLKQLQSLKSIRLPVLDETGYTGHVDLKLQAELSDLPALRKELRRYNLDLVEADRTLPVLVIREKAP